MSLVGHVARLTGLALGGEGCTTPLLGGLLEELAVETLLVRLEVVAGGAECRALVFCARDESAVRGVLGDGTPGGRATVFVLSDVARCAAQPVGAELRIKLLVDHVPLEDRILLGQGRVAALARLHLGELVVGVHELAHDPRAHGDGVSAPTPVGGLGGVTDGALVGVQGFLDVRPLRGRIALGRDGGRPVLLEPGVRSSFGTVALILLRGLAKFLGPEASGSGTRRGSVTGPPRPVCIQRQTSRRRAPLGATRRPRTHGQSEPPTPSYG